MALLLFAVIALFLAGCSSKTSEGSKTIEGSKTSEGAETIEGGSKLRIYVNQNDVFYPKTVFLQSTTHYIAEIDLGTENTDRSKVNWLEMVNMPGAMIMSGRELDVEAKINDIYRSKNLDKVTIKVINREQKIINFNKATSITVDIYLPEEYKINTIENNKGKFGTDINKVIY